MSTVVRLHRDLPAPPDKVYRAWLDPDLLRRWMAPGGLAVTRAEVEPRVGGRYRIWHDDAGTDVGGFDCEIVELEQDRRIVWRWGFVGPRRETEPRFDSLLTVTLAGNPAGGTALTLVHERLDDLAAALPQVAGGVGAGWASALDKLAEVAA
ncbi:SRPBCC domain-containing protein [Micromonospora sp. A3M-1-15]|uniref:SRPBCC family protein n=1 Tax=Micromonospora sp. A3M-1-15 TaxID=2962035 RepID=UPI0020B8E08E|nr:SRPBCC domain-containing protein [Micromonospora sp. A3M-1-15]MCP3782893.1 SRPBCC domain-containing protein [Micromonospora sp. A3M-1-15]